MQETDGEPEAAAAAVVVTGRNAATREAEVEVIAENATVVAVDEATVVATREVVAPLAIVTVNCYTSYRKAIEADGDDQYTNEKSFLLRGYRQELLE